MSAPEGWEAVVGLEVHAELLTRTKLFSASPNRFGGEPNTHIDPTSLGLPGSLPVLNRAAVELAIRAGLALGCEIRRSVFARKNYFYPDMPKDYQISQYELPICAEGHLELPDGTQVGIERAHLEEDTGKSTHAVAGGGGGGRIHDAEYSLVDYNRAGVPLLEIVGRPDLRTAEQARAYVSELRAVLVAVGASDGKMEEGSLRVDCNVSVRRPGEPLGTRCEIKNVNSLRSLGRAIEYEAARQVDLLSSGETVRQETRHWNEDEGRTVTLRSKEEATDYRYFPEPDLVELDPDPAWVESIRAALPPLPADRRHRLVEATGAAPDVAGLLVERGLDELVAGAVAAGADAARVLTHAEHDMAGEGAAAVPPGDLADLVRMEGDGALTATQAKAVLAEMIDGGGRPADIAAARGFEAMAADELATLVDELIAAHPDEFDRLRAGEQKVMGFFVGQVMKATSGKADGKAVSALLRERAG